MPFSSELPMSSRVGPLALWLGNRYRPVSPILKRPPLVREALETSLVQVGTSGSNYDNLGSVAMNSRADLAGRVQNGEVYYTGIDVYQTKNTRTDNTGSGFALGATTSSHTVGSTQTTESRGGNSGSWYGSKLESGNSTTHYTTVSGTMGQPFSGMTQTGFNIITLYGTAAQTGITGMYGYGQTGTGTTTPFTYVLAEGEPNVSTPGGEYSGSQPGVVPGSVTPVSNKIIFGDPGIIFVGLDPRNPYSCLFDPRQLPKSLNFNWENIKLLSSIKPASIDDIPASINDIIVKHPVFSKPYIESLMIIAKTEFGSGLLREGISSEVKIIPISRKFELR